MCGSKPGYSLLEVVIVLAIVGILLTISVPRFIEQRNRKVDDFVENLSQLTRFAYVRALATGKVHRLFFKIGDTATVRLEAEESRTKRGELVFKPVTQAAITPFFEWSPSELTITNFFIKRIDEARKNTLKEAWFFVLPMGISQEIIINVRDVVTGVVRGLILNPFSVIFEAYDTPQKP